MSRSDVDLVLSMLPRIVEACRARGLPSGARVSAHQARILRQLDDRDPTMVGELAEMLRVTPSTMSLNLKRLEGAGYVERSRDPEDRRVMNVVLTPLGREMRDRTAELDRSRVDAMLGALWSEDREPVVRALSLLAEAADRMRARGVAYVEALAGPG